MALSRLFVAIFDEVLLLLVLPGRRLKLECCGRPLNALSTYLGFVLKQTNDDDLDIVPLFISFSDVKQEFEFQRPIVFQNE